MLSDSIPPLVPERVPDDAILGGVVSKAPLMDVKTHHKSNAVPDALEACHAHLAPLLLKADALNLDFDHSDSALLDRLGQEGFVPAPERDSIDSDPPQL